MDLDVEVKVKVLWPTVVKSGYLIFRGLAILPWGEKAEEKLEASNGGRCFEYRLITAEIRIRFDAEHRKGERDTGARVRGKWHVSKQSWGCGRFDAWGQIFGRVLSVISDNGCTVDVGN